MGKLATLNELLRRKLIAVVRSPDPGPLVEAAAALAEGGVSVIEITLTVPNALAVVAAVRKRLGDRVVVGAGTVLDAETARAALDAGAEFLVGPTLNFEVIRLCHRHDAVVLPGAFTPTEILAAWEAGADIVKVFPAEAVGPKFFKAMAGPLPHIRLMPTGGVDLQTARSFLDAGAVCLGLGSSLVDRDALVRGDFARLTELARQYATLV